MRGDNLEFQKYTARREGVNYLVKNLRKWIRYPISVLRQANPKAAGHFQQSSARKGGSPQYNQCLRESLPLMRILEARTLV